MNKNVNYIDINKDIRQIKSKFLLGLTKRQCICFGLAILFGFPTFLLVKSAINNLMIPLLAMILIAAPFIVCGIGNHNGLPYEKYIISMIKFIRSNKVRTYQSENIYSAIARQAEYSRLIKTVEYKEEFSEVLKKNINLLIKKVRKIAEKRQKNKVGG